MSFKKFAFSATALAALTMVGGVSAQTNEQLREALAQAQAAATQAQAAAKQAQDALAQVQGMMAKQAAAAPAPAASQASSSPGGFTLTSGQNSVTLYGLIDVSYVNRNNANAAQQSYSGPRVAWFSGNRIGVTGQRAIGGADNMKAIFKLESEFESQTGNQDTPGVLFNRDAWLGLQSDSLGKLTLGRQNALARDPAASGIYGDPYGGSKAGLDEGGYTNKNNFKQLVFYAGSATGTRYDNGVVWKKEFGNVVAGLGYQFGGVTGAFNRGSTKTGSLAYNGDSYTVSGFVNSANINELTHTSYSIGGNAQVAPMVRLYGGYFGYNAKQAAAIGDRKDSAYALAAKFSPNPTYDFHLGFNTIRAQNAGVNGSGYVANAFTDASGLKASGTGNRNAFYASAFYNLDSSTSLYVAGDRLKTTGTYLDSAAVGAKSQNQVALGLRFKF